MHFLQKTQTIQQSLSACEVRRVLFLIIDVLGTDIETKAADSEHFAAWIKVCVSPTFLRWVFGWNGLVKIVFPQEVCEDYRQMLENALRTQEL